MRKSETVMEKNKLKSGSEEVCSRLRTNTPGVNIVDFAQSLVLYNCLPHCFAVVQFNISFIFIPAAWTKSVRLHCESVMTTLTPGHLKGHVQYSSFVQYTSVPNKEIKPSSLYMYNYIYIRPAEMIIYLSILDASQHS